MVASSHCADGSVVAGGDLLALALASPHSTADSARDTNTQTYCCGNDDERNGDLGPESLLVGQVLEQVAAA